MSQTRKSDFYWPVWISFDQSTMRMLGSSEIICPIGKGLSSRCYNRTLLMLNVHGEYMRKRMNVMKMLSDSTSQKIVLKRLKKKPARPRSSIGRSHTTKQCACSTPGAIILRFCVYGWTGENDSNTLRVDANFFKNGEKNLRSQKYPHTCGRGLNHIQR